MAAPPLNPDVLAIVCEFLRDVSDVLSMALTCSSVHAISVAQILRMRAVYLKSGPPIRRFHSFLANAPARARHVRAIDIDLREPQRGSDDCSVLLDILASCTRLEHLTLAFGSASLKVIADPRFLQAIAAIPSLRSLSLRSMSVDVLSIFPHIGTSIRRLKIACTHVDASSRFPIVLEQSLPRVVAQSLETFSLDKFAVDLHGDIQTPASLLMPSIFNTRPYPGVRSFSVKSLKGRPLLDHLQHLFPALDGTLILGFLDIQVHEETYSYIRTANQRSQEDHGLESSSGTWKKLDRLICGASMLYVLGLRCPIRLIVMEYNVVDEDVRYIADALQENPVPRLHLSVSHNFGAFDRLFPPNLAQTLTHLTLCLIYSNDYGFKTSEDQRLRWDGVLVSYSSLPQLHTLNDLRNVFHRTRLSPPSSLYASSRTSGSLLVSAYTSTRTHRGRSHLGESMRTHSARRGLTSKGPLPCSHAPFRRFTTSSSRPGGFSRAGAGSTNALTWRGRGKRRSQNPVGSHMNVGTSVAVGASRSLGLRTVMGWQRRSEAL